MHTSMRSFRGCGFTSSLKNPQTVSALPPAARRYSDLPYQPLVTSPFAPQRRQHRSVLLAAQKSDASLPSAATVRSKRSTTGKEGSAPLPSHEDDILLVPASHLHIEQLERHDIYTLSDFRRAYEREKVDFRRFLQDKIQVRDEKHLTAMEAFFRMADQQQQQPAGASRSGEAAAPAPAAAAAAVPEGAVVAAARVPLGMTSDQVTLSLEGNISAGKSTFLSILERHLFTDDGFTFVKEPIEQWQCVGGTAPSSSGGGGGGVNLLDLFYRDPKRMAYTFQNFVFLTRVLQERETYGNTTKARILERSVFSDRMVFVRAVHSSQDLADHELAMYDAWFGPLLASLPTLVPNGLIYLRASPATCMARLKKRGRSEEGGIPLDYLKCLHANHEDWLVQAATRASELRQQLLLQQAQTETAAGATGAADLAEAREARRRSSAGASTSAAPAASPPLSLSAVAEAQRQQQRLPSPAALVPLAAAPPAALGCVEVPDSLADMLYIIDATKVSGVPPAGYLHQLPALVLDCDADVDVHGDTAYGQRISNLIRDFTSFVSAYRSASHRIAAERRAAAAANVSSSPSSSAAADAASSSSAAAAPIAVSSASSPAHSSSSSSSSPSASFTSTASTCGDAGRPLPHPSTDYYTTDDVGRVSYRPVVPDVPGGVANGAASAAAASRSPGPGPAAV